MSCKDALVKKVILISPDINVADAIAIISEHAIRAVPVVDNDANYYGMFGLHSLMDDLLPIAARMEGGITDLSFVEGGAPGAAKRIRKLSPHPVKTVIHAPDGRSLLTPDIPILEVIRRLSQFGSPLPVVDENKKFLGIVTEQSCLEHLARVLRQVEEEEKQQ